MISSEVAIRQQRWLIAACVAMITLAGWLYLLHEKSSMGNMNMPGMASTMVMPDGTTMLMPAAQQWNMTSILLLFVMWSVMMVAMMVPSAMPMILAFLTLNQHRKASDRPLVPIGVFLFGYLAVWTAYSALASVAQWQLHRAAFLSSAMASTSPFLSGGLLVAAGIFQWTPLKRVCLEGCRSPVSFLMRSWRDGTFGAFLMGIRHGTYCVGCCWVLMALLFVAGVMNLVWVAVIAVFVMAEKILAKGELLGHVAGIALVTAGVALMTRSW